MGQKRPKFVSLVLLVTKRLIQIGNETLREWKCLFKKKLVKKLLLKKPKLFPNKKEHICFVIEIISFNFKDNFLPIRETLVCGNIFYNCPIVSTVQTAWMVNCGHQRVVFPKRNFAVVSDSDLKKVFRKALEKLGIFDNLITFNTKTLEMGHQDGCRLNNWSVFDAFYTEITWCTESFIF